MKSIEIKVNGMTCQHCVMRVEKALLSVEGVKSASVHLNSGTAKIEYNGDSDPYDQLILAVEEAGYSAE